MLNQKRKKQMEKPNYWLESLKILYEMIKIRRRKFPNDISLLELKYRVFILMLKEAQ